MNIVLLSGGSGKRLWPLSNDIRSKQFIKIFSNNGDYESMLQRVYRQILSTDLNANVVIATSKSQVSSIRNQLGPDVNVCVEPSRRDTFPAIALASAYLHDIVGIDKKEVVVVCPVDPYVKEDYFQSIQSLFELAEREDTNLSLMGIEPTYPSEKYGYIIPENTELISKVKSFKEKPNIQLAEQYIGDGALWNAGVFAFRLKYVLNKAKTLFGTDNYEELLDNYDSLTKISFDYAVVENELSTQVLKFSGQWMDIGTWNTLTEAMDKHIIGKAVLNDNCLNTNVINELEIPILCMGTNNLIISASAEGILVSDKNESSFIKPFVDEFEGPVMFAEKSWGSYRVLEVEENSLTIKVTLLPGNKMNYHSHVYRDEIWTVISGNGLAFIDNERIPVKEGDVLQIRAGVKHTIVAITELKIIEVQIGQTITVEDKIKHELKKDDLLID